MTPSHLCKKSPWQWLLTSQFSVKELDKRIILGSKNRRGTFHSIPDQGLFFGFSVQRGEPSGSQLSCIHWLSRWPQQQTVTLQGGSGGLCGGQNLAATQQQRSWLPTCTLLVRISQTWFSFGWQMFRFVQQLRALLDVVFFLLAPENHGWSQSLHICPIPVCFCRCPICNLGNSNPRLEGYRVVALNNATARWNSHCLWMLCQPFLFISHQGTSQCWIVCYVCLRLSQNVSMFAAQMISFWVVQQVQLAPFVVLIPQWSGRPSVELVAATGPTNRQKR